MKTNLPYKIPEHMKPILENLKKGNRFTIIYPRRSGRKTSEMIYKEYMKYLKKKRGD